MTDLADPERGAHERWEEVLAMTNPEQRQLALGAALSASKTRSPRRRRVDRRCARPESVDSRSPNRWMVATSPRRVAQSWVMSGIHVGASGPGWTGSLIGATPTYYQLAIAELERWFFVPRSRCELRSNGQIFVAVSLEELKSSSLAPPLDIGFGVPPGAG